MRGAGAPGKIEPRLLTTSKPKTSGKVLELLVRDILGDGVVLFLELLSYFPVQKCSFGRASGLSPEKADPPRLRAVRLARD